jgi:uncharacterized protein YdhG (YjbR/CyaY superfamily)
VRHEARRISRQAASLAPCTSDEATTVKGKEIDDYLEKLGPDRRAALAQVRSLILEAVPDAVESMKYRMPTYEYGGAMLCAFASQKRYMSLYVEPPILDGHSEELLRLDLGKSCIRFKSIDQLPLATVRAILRETVQAIDGQHLDRG